VMAPRLTDKAGEPQQLLPWRRTNDRHEPTGLEHRSSPQAAVDGRGRCAHSYGSDRHQTVICSGSRPAWDIRGMILDNAGRRDAERQRRAVTDSEPRMLLKPLVMPAGRGAGSHAGATGTNNPRGFRTYMNNGQGPHPRSRTVLNGSGCPHMEPRIRCPVAVEW
jgi:hypothetical protein